MRTVKLLMARFPGHRTDDPDTTDWWLETVLKAKADPRIAEVLQWRIDDTPITMGRNRCLEVAKQLGVDYVLMIDNDMKPDCYLESNPNRLAIHLDAKPFWDTSFDFLYQLDKPAAIAAPYCGPPPCENVYVFRWCNQESHNPNVDFRLDQFTRETAEYRQGIEEVAALPTGIFLMDLRMLALKPPPYFYYEWKDATESEKASTEDVTFTRDMSLLGVPMFCNWDAWAGHWKRKCVGKPVGLSPHNIRASFARALQRNLGERQVLEVHGFDPSSMVTTDEPCS